MLRRFSKVAAPIGAILVLGAWKSLERSGEYVRLGPKVNKPANIDNKLRIASWNMQGKASTRYDQIGKLVARKRLDAVALQEVTRNDAEVLSNKFKTWNLIFVLGDRKQHILEGGYGNVLMTRQAPRDIHSNSMPGSTFLATVAGGTAGLGLDALTGNTRFKNTKDGLQESRAAVAATIKVKSGDGYRDVRLVTGHIAGVNKNAGPEIHNEQFKDFMKFIGRNTSDNYPTVVCGDFNSDPDAVEPALAENRMITVPNQKATTLGGDVFDYCGYHEASVLGLGDLEVLDSPVTDHRPIIASWEIEP